MGRVSKDKSVSSQDRLFGAHTIIHEDEPYMTRYWFWRFRVHVFHRGDKDMDCHDHPWDFWTFPLTSYVEEVLVPVREAVAYRPDGSPITEPLNRWLRRYQVVKAWRIHKRQAEHCHRVLGNFEGMSFKDFVVTNPDKDEFLVGNAKIITIVYQAGVRRSWGFWKERANRWCWEPWRKYVLEGGRDQPCSDGPAYPPPHISKR